jgi:hypothetical protein
VLDALYRWLKGPLLTAHFTGIDEGQMDEFALWAFGENYEKMTPMDCLKAWNSRHSDKLKLTLESKISKDAPKMVELWKKSKP